MISSVLILTLFPEFCSFLGQQLSSALHATVSHTALCLTVLNTHLCLGWDCHTGLGLQWRQQERLQSGEAGSTPAMLSQDMMAHTVLQDSLTCDK